MKGSHTEGIAGKLCGVLIFTILLIVIPSVFFDFYYDLNDDTAIKDILSGAYTGDPSAYCIQMLYPLSWFIAMLYRAIPILPWYGLFLCLCQFGVFIIIAWRLINITKGSLARVAALVIELLIVFGLFFRELVIIQYSVTSAICMVGAVFLFMTGKNSEKASVFIRRNIVPVLLVILSFMIRTEICIMLMPFLLLAGIVYWMKEKEVFSSVNIRKYLTVVMCALVGMLVVFSLDKLAYTKNGWSSFLDFFDARTDVYDFYGIPSYDENKEFYDEIGLSRESYVLLENYNFALDDSINSWMLEAISKYQKQRAYNGETLNSTLGFVSRNSLKEAVWLYKEHILTGIKALTGSFFENNSNIDGAICTYAVIGAYAVYILICFLAINGKEKKQAIFKVLTLLVIRSILWLYLYMADRVLDRVTTPLIMMELTVVIGFILMDLPKHKSCESSKKEKLTFVFNSMTNVVVMIFTVLFLGAALINNFKAVTEEYTNRQIADERWNVLMDYCRSNHKLYYVIDVYSSTSYNGTPYSEKIFEKESHHYKNFDICGGWVAKSPLAEQKFKKEEIKNLKSALLGKEKTLVYFVAGVDKDLSWIADFYEKRGQYTEPVCVDNIKNSDNETIFKVYKLK